MPCQVLLNQFAGFGIRASFNVNLRLSAASVFSEWRACAGVFRRRSPLGLVVNPAASRGILAPAQPFPNTLQRRRNPPPIFAFGLVRLKLRPGSVGNPFVRSKPGPLGSSGGL